jgi:hypothetical protein
MATTYTLISSVTVGSGGAANIEFTSIPGTYTDLVCKYSCRNTGDSPNLEVSFNAVTTNRSDRVLSGNGASASSFADATIIYGLSGRSTSTSSTFSNGEVYLPNYAGSTNKSLSQDAITENNATEAFAYLVAGLWSNTNAITSLKLTPSSGNFAQHSTAYLYGIKNS